MPQLGWAWPGSAQLGSARVEGPRLSSAWLGLAQPISTQLGPARFDLAGADSSWLGSARLGYGIGLGGLSSAWPETRLDSALFFDCRVLVFW